MANRVIYHGVEMAADWPAKIVAAQAVTTYTLNGRQVARVAYARDGVECLVNQPCFDCAVLPGQLHVPGCELERCPVCGGQVVNCGCLDTLTPAVSVVETSGTAEGED